MFKFTEPPDAAAQLKGMSLQLNLLSMKHWSQPTLYLLGSPLPGWTPVCFNTDVSDAEEKLMFPNSEIAYYLVGMTTDQGYDVGAPTGVSLSDVLEGRVWVNASYYDESFFFSMVDALTGKLLYSAPFSMKGDPAYILCAELVGPYEGESVSFQSLEAELLLNSSKPVQVATNPGEIEWGKRDGLKVVWNDETIESSNVDTVIGTKMPNWLGMTLQPEASGE
jgi:hypothetical protein